MSICPTCGDGRPGQGEVSRLTHTPGARGGPVSREGMREMQPMTHDELKEAYESYFRLRMKDVDFARMVHELGPYGLVGLHNMLWCFFERGAQTIGN